MNKKVNIKEVSVDELIDAIRKLKSEKPEKKQWIHWLSEYDEPSYYNRLAGMNRSAEWAYNHLANPEMLLWLIEAAGIKKELVELAKSDCKQITNPNRQSGVIRKHVSWAMLERALWRHA